MRGTNSWKDHREKEAFLTRGCEFGMAKAMESVTTIGVVAAGLFFSVACALLLEELIFGGLFRFFFAPRTGRPQRTDVSTPHNQKKVVWGTQR
jgi:hypothetical protein